MLAANKAYLEAAQNSRGIIQNSCGITFVFHAKNTIVNVELFATGPFVEKFRPICITECYLQDFVGESSSAPTNKAFFAELQVHPAITGGKQQGCC